MTRYYCGEKGCKGHHAFSENCASVVRVVHDLPVLLSFIQGIGEEETQPFVPIRDEALPEKARGQSTPAMKAYDNKMKTSLDPAYKQKNR
jgi:hypothetical protein